MKKLWFPALAAALVLVGCTPDHTLESLIPRNALAVVVIDHPGWADQVLGGQGGIPWKSLATDKPWGAAVLPASPPGFLIAVALADAPMAWPELRQWAQDRGGLKAVRLGSYAVLTSPGVADPSVLDSEQRFDLARVRAGGDPLAMYIDTKNLMAVAKLSSTWKPMIAIQPWVEKNVSGLRLGFAPKDGGLEWRIASDWVPASEAASTFQGWVVPIDPASWAGQLPTEGVGLVASLPVATWQMALSQGDPALTRRWAALAPSLGPRLAAVAGPQPDGSWSWTVAVETRDSQAVRQALKTLVAGGDLQKSFPQWALDGDTPLIYQDQRGAANQASLRWGPAEVTVAYGTDRVVLAGGPRPGDSVARALRTETPPAWVNQAPQGSTALLAGAVDGLGAKAAFRVLADGNIEFRTWIDAASVKTWEERLPQALMGWLSSAGGLTRWEP